MQPQIYMKNPLNQKEKLQAKIIGDFSLSSILEITKYKTKNGKKVLTPQKTAYLTKTSTRISLKPNQVHLLGFTHAPPNKMERPLLTLWPVLI